MFFNILKKPVTFAAIIMIIAFAVVPLNAEETGLFRLKIVSVPDSPTGDWMKEAFDQINACISALNEKKYENLTQHRVFTEGRRKNEHRRERSGYKIWGKMVITDGNVVQVNFYWFDEAFIQMSLHERARLHLVGNEGYVLLFEKDGTPVRYLEGQFYRIIDKIHPPKIALANGIEIKFHHNGVVSSYKTIAEGKRLGRTIEWNENGNVIKDEIVEKPLFDSDFELESIPP